MKTATITTLKAKLSEHIAHVKRGEEIIVTERGKPVARLIPIPKEVSEDTRIARLVAKGLMRPGNPKLLREYLANIEPIQVSEEAFRRAFEEEREDRA
jgi:prevent-host-death family protein